MHCKIDTKTLVQIAEDAARRVYSEGQRIDNERIRAIVRCECERILEEKSEEECTSTANAGEPWTINEDNMLKAELAAFFTATARKHERSHGAIVSRIKQINERKS